LIHFYKRFVDCLSLGGRLRKESLLCGQVIAM